MTKLLHADDAVGEIGHRAGAFASVVLFNLMAAQSPSLERGKRAEALERLFMAWAPLCRIMGELEQAAPASAAHGYEQAQRLREFGLNREAAKAATASDGGVG